MAVHELRASSRARRRQALLAKQLLQFLQMVLYHRGKPPLVTLFGAASGRRTTLASRTCLLPPGPCRSDAAVPAPVVLAGGGLLRRRAGGHPLGELQCLRRPREVRIEARRSPFTDGGHRTQDRRSVVAVGSLESHRSAVSGSAALQGMELRLIRCSPQRAGRLPAPCPVPPAAGTTALWLRPLRRRPRRGGSRRVRSSRARWGCLPRTITTKPDRDLGQSRPHMPD